jgi:murein L,D-transpeptidase YafK
MMRRFFRLLGFVFCASVAFTPNVMASGEAVELVLSRSQHMLMIKQNGKTLRSYKVALGSGGSLAKSREGDYKTPSGQYRVTNIRESDKFHLFIQLNYPNMADATKALRSDVISRQQYRDILDAHVYGLQPPQNTALGGAIGIHGIGLETDEKVQIHQSFDWTRGCIALRNQEIEELSQLVSAGTLVNIVD